MQRLDAEGFVEILKHPQRSWPESLKQIFIETENKTSGELVFEIYPACFVLCTCWSSPTVWRRSFVTRLWTASLGRCVHWGSCAFVAGTRRHASLSCGPIGRPCESLSQVHGDQLLVSVPHTDDRVTAHIDETLSLWQEARHGRQNKSSGSSWLRKRIRVKKILLKKIQIKKSVFEFLC